MHKGGAKCQYMKIKAVKMAKSITTRYITLVLMENISSTSQRDLS